MGWRGRRGRVGHSAAGRTFALSQVNHSGDVSWGGGGDSAGEEASFRQRARCV